MEWNVLLLLCMMVAHKNHHYHRQRWQRRKKHLKLMQSVERKKDDKNIFHSCKIEHIREEHWRFISWMNEMATNIHEWINLCWNSNWICYRVMGNFHNFIFPCDFIYLQFLNHTCMQELFQAKCTQKYLHSSSSTSSKV